MNHITQKDLETLVSQLNKVCNTPMEYSTNGTINIGNFHMYYAYGQVGLQQTTNTSGGCNTAFYLTTKRELYSQIQAFIAGIEYRNLETI